MSFSTRFSQEKLDKSLREEISQRYLSYSIFFSSIQSVPEENPMQPIVPMVPEEIFCKRILTIPFVRNIWLGHINEYIFYIVYNWIELSNLKLGDVPPCHPVGTSI